jgi:hypothetical protein
MVAFVDHGPAGSGEPVAALLRPGSAGSNTAADHIETAQLALAQLPEHLRRGRQTLIRTDSGGGHAFLDWLSKPGRWLSYCVGTTITDTIHQVVLKIPKKAWPPAYDAGGTERSGAWVAEITDMPDPEHLTQGHAADRPSQLRFTDRAAADPLRDQYKGRPARRPRTASGRRARCGAGREDGRCPSAAHQDPDVPGTEADK